jgi:sterol desaturase/sphingolipid hydroxylase (fatty acid hydroxylase superfamily)
VLAAFFMMIAYNYWLAGLFFAFCVGDYLFLSATDRKRLPGQWLLHFGIFVAAEILALIVPFTAILFATYSISKGYGLLPWLGVGPVAGFIVWVLADSFTEYVGHVASHKYPVLWAFHRVHHCDELVDASTGFRHHPLEVLWSLAIQCISAFALAPAPEIILMWYFVSTLMQFYSHSRIELPSTINRALEILLATPRIHRVHHSSYAPQTDSNYGGIFTIWDRVFQTFCTETPKHLGLDDAALSGEKSRDFDTLIFEPFGYLLNKLRR